MRHLSQEHLFWLRCQEIEPAVNLERIRANNFRVELARNLCCNLGFPDRGGTDDKERFHVGLVKPNRFLLRA